MDVCNPFREGERLGPLTWSRFLVYHFHCELEDLNAQLPKPILPGEQFRFGITPPPADPAAFAPKVFEQAFYRGRNPDGAYVQEWKDKKKRFNIFVRVVARVPDSAPWLLQELGVLLEGKCPTIDFSDSVCRKTLDALGLSVLDPKCVQAWDEVAPESLVVAEQATLKWLSECPLPEVLALAYSLFHLAIWHHSHYDLRGRLAETCHQATRAFERSPVFTDDDGNIKIALRDHLFRAMHAVEEFGSRFLATGIPTSLPERLVLFKKTHRNAAAMQCLHVAGDWGWEQVFKALPPEFCPSGFIGPQEIEAAAAALSVAAEEMRLEMNGLVERRLQRYRDRPRIEEVQRTGRSSGQRAAG